MTSTVTRRSTWAHSVPGGTLGSFPDKEVPDDWPMVRLGEILAFSNGVNADKRAYGHGVPFVNVLEVITSSHLRASDIPGRVMLSEAQRDTFHVRRGDILFNRTSETQEEVGLSAVYEDDGRTVFGGFVIRGRPTCEGLESQYAGYALRAPAVRSQITAKAQGAVRANIAQASLKEVLVPLPPPPEQRAIAQALSDVDGLLGALEALIAKKRAIKRAAMQQLLTGKTRLPGFSGAWETRRLGDHVTFLRTGTNSRAELNKEGPIQYLHYGDIHTSTRVRLDPRLEVMPHLPEERAASLDRLRDGDLVFVDASEDLDGVGKSLEITGAAEAEVVAGLHTIAARFDKSVIVNGFKAFLQSCPAFRAHLRRLAAGTKVYATNRSHISTAEVPLPPPEEQTAIATVLSDMDTEIAALEHRRDKTRTIKQGMMQQLLPGRVRLVEPEAAG